MSKKTWIIFIVVCVLLVGSLMFFSKKDSIDTEGVDAKKIISKSDSNGNIGDHVYGKADSKVLVIEYGDFQCPGCGVAFQTTKQVKEKYKDKVAFVFRNFPIAQIHPNALAAASSAEAAGLQGKYWEMFRLIYENQSAWENLGGNERTDQFMRYAESIGLNADKFTEDVSSDSVSKKIKFDLAIGRDFGVVATPSYYLNGEQISPDDYGTVESFSKLLDKKLKETAK